MARIGVLDFVKRQTPLSKHDHFDGSWEELITLIEAHWEARTVSSNNPDVLLVPMPTEVLHRFFSSTISLTDETPLSVKYAPRMEGETPYLQVTAQSAHKTPAIKVEMILYSHEVLAQDGDAPPTREADYYIVSINAYPTKNPSPMSPMTMARNFLGLKGGTKPTTPYTAEEFAQAIMYWNQHAQVSPLDTP